MMLRDARPTDATAIARVHVRAWQAAYRGLLPDGYLDALRAEDRVARFPLGTQDPRAARTIVALLDGSIAGFVSLGPSRDDDAPQAGEVYALYVEPSRWDRGVGRTLMRAANARLRAAGFDEALLWVLVGNRRAERFYESEGWRVDGARRTVGCGGGRSPLQAGSRVRRARWGSQGVRAERVRPWRSPCGGGIDSVTCSPSAEQRPSDQLNRELPTFPDGSDAPAVPDGVNLGAGHTYVPGFVNVDISERAEVTLDLSSEPLPFPDDSVQTVLSIHTLEHIPNYLFALGEIHRVLRHDGALLLKLPYATLTESHLVNPYHLHNFNERSFDFFDPARLRGSAAESTQTAFRKVFVRFTYMGYFGLAPRPLRVWARRHLLNVVRQFDIALVAIKDRDRPVDTSAHRALELESQLAELMRRRIPYPETDAEGPLAPRPEPARRSPRLRERAAGAVQRRTHLRGQ